MPKIITFRKGLASVLFWSIISAAFIGPGTVTTASNAGAVYGLDLLWALTFATLATIVLQEQAARVTIASGKSLGEIIAIKYANTKNKQLPIALFLAVAFGCAVYQAGNILGAVSGLLFLATGVPQAWLTLIMGLFCGISLWTGNTRAIAYTLGMAVFAMGIAFCWLAAKTEFSWIEFLKDSIVPTFPTGSTLLIIGLIGTTIVPYNLFLASGIGQGQDVREMQLGVVIAVLLGGIISAALLVVGLLIVGNYSYEALIAAMETKLGNFATTLFGFGLFAAGTCSAITAPLAAAISGRDLLGGTKKSWQVRGINFRTTWMIVLVIGLTFSLLQFQPIPAIIVAQAINGLLLPIVSVFLILVMNDRTLLPVDYLNSTFSNIAILLVFGACCALGLDSVWKALEYPFPILETGRAIFFWLNLLFTFGMLAWLGRKIWQKGDVLAK